jgi:hypothetical protein
MYRHSIEMALKSYLAVSLMIMMMMMSSTNAFDYLVLAPFPFLDQWLFMETFIHKLLSYGHHVTAITPYRLTNTRSDPFENYREIRIPEYDLSEICKRVCHCVNLNFSFSFLLSF